MNFEWHARKASLNAVKHGVTFEEASTVFLDPLAMTYPDPASENEEDREITIGSYYGTAVAFCGARAAWYASAHHQR
jgi:uncharacterized protein